MKTSKVIIVMAVVGIAVSLGWIWIYSQPKKPTKQELEAVLAVRDTRMTKGESDAPVQMVQYVDMMCADCARSHEEMMPRIEKDYVDAGKLHYEVRVVSKIHHDDADAAAGGAYCAAEQDKFWQYLDLGYEELHKLHEAAKGVEDYQAFSGNNLRALAQKAGLNVPAWEYCVSQDAYKNIIDQHEKDMSSLNAYGTPHSVINGENYNGAPPYEVFKTVIDAALTKKQESI